MVLVPLLLAPAVMLVATLLERRLGPAAAGWVGAAPVVIVIAVLAVGTRMGPASAAALAGGAAAHVVAQVAFALTVVVVAGRRRAAGGRGGVVGGLLAGVGVFVLVAAPVGLLPTALAPLTGGVALLAGRRLLTGRRMLAAGRAGAGPVAQPGVRGDADARPDPPAARPVAQPVALVIAVRVAATLVAVGAVVAVASLVGPGAAGTVSAFPAFSTALALLIARDRGVDGVIDVFRGTVLALPGYLAFCLTVWLATPPAGTGAAVALGLAACLVVYRLVLPRTGARRQGAGTRDEHASVPIAIQS
jgi:uncharacterized membrane protein (GlpM family)